MIDVKFVPLCSVIFDKIAVDVTDVLTLEKLLERMQVEIRSYGQERELEQISLEITLIGRTKLFRVLQDNHEVLDVKSILLEYHHLFDLKIKVAVKTTFDEQLLKNKNTVLGDVLKTIDEMKVPPKLEYLSEEAELEHIKDGMAEQIMDYFLEGYDED